MKQAKVVGYVQGLYNPARPPETKNAENRTIIMSIRKERRRRQEEQAKIDEKRVASGKFNSIRMQAKG